MQELKNDRVLRALMRQPVDYTPVWMMRQAGRYLPEYRATRARAGSFLDLCTNPELACEVTLQPLERFPLDAAILFSDILTIPDAMGLGLRFSEGEGPHFERPIGSEADVRNLPVPDPEEDLRYVLDAVRLIRQELHGRVPLIGFCGSPWTLATYMVEGGASKNFARVKRIMYDRPQLMHLLLEKLTRALVAYLDAQVCAGAQALMVFDTWGGVLSGPCFREFSLAYMERIARSVTRYNLGRPVPVILYTKGGAQWLKEMSQSGCDALGVDWTIEIGEARARVGDRIALQGNLDPSLLYASPERIRKGVGEVLQSYGRGPGHVFNLGHGIHPDVDPDHAGAMVQAVHELSAQYHEDT